MTVKDLKVNKIKSPVYLYYFSHIRVFSFAGYAVLFAPQFGQNVAVCGKRAAQYLHGIITTWADFSSDSSSSEPQPHPQGHIFKSPLC
jgi:hypothetical protein